MLPGPQRLDHVAIEVHDFDARVEVLVTAMGMRLHRIGALVSDPARRIAMVGDGAGTKLELVEAPADTATAPDRTLHVAWRYDSAGDVDAAFAALLDGGAVAVAAPRRFEPARSYTATLAVAGNHVQLVAYDADSPDQ